MRGVRVGFAEIEATIVTVPGVVECAAVAVPHDESGEALALYVVAAEDARDVALAVRRRLPSEWTCASVSMVTELPRNENGKLMRAQLAQMVRTALAGRDARAAASVPRALAADEAAST